MIRPVSDQGVTVRRAATAGLLPPDPAAIAPLLHAAFDDLEPEDIEHAMGGIHWLAELDGLLVGHASVVPRILEADGRPIETGYVEAVGVHPAHQRSGIGTRLMLEAAGHLAEAYALGALGTGEHAFY